MVNMESGENMHQASECPDSLSDFILIDERYSSGIFRIYYYNICDKLVFNRAKSSKYTTMR
jgi:hypothetical protein